MIIVSNTTPLIGLASIQRFSLLHPSIWKNIYCFSISQRIIDSVLHQAHE